MDVVVHKGRVRPCQEDSLEEFIDVSALSGFLIVYVVACRSSVVHFNFHALIG